MEYHLIDGKFLFETTCSWCQSKYYAKRQTSKTCSNKCRQGAYRGRIRVAEWREDAKKALRRKKAARN